MLFVSEKRQHINKSGSVGLAHPKNPINTASAGLKKKGWLILLSIL